MIAQNAASNRAPATQRPYTLRESKSRCTSLGSDARSIVFARSNLDFVAAIEIPRAWAISFVLWQERSLHFSLEATVR
jgi:hypothetical protein